MNAKLKDEIKYLQSASDVSKITKGFSHDEKYLIDGNYLLRIFPNHEAKKRRQEFETINKLATYSEFVPKGLEFAALKGNDKAYMILTYIRGTDAEVSLCDLTEDEQYTAGVFAGRELHKLHQLSAPSNYPSWFTVKKDKSDRYLKELKQINMDEKIKRMLEGYIKDHEHLMKDRPNMFQHDDFHPSNIVIHEKRFAGIIDFQRMDWGDPIHDLQKLGFFSKRISVMFTKGIIDGYHDNQKVDENFWSLYALYSAIHIVSALVWAKKFSPKEFELFLGYSLDVMKDHENFKCTIPVWYKNEN